MGKDDGNGTSSTVDLITSPEGEPKVRRLEGEVLVGQVEGVRRGTRVTRGREGGGEGGPRGEVGVVGEERRSENRGRISQGSNKDPVLRVRPMGR